MEPRPEQLFDIREFPVLYVDDEPDNLRVFELTFRRQFTIHTAESPARIRFTSVSVSASVRVVPGAPVNASVTWKGWLRKACSLAARPSRRCSSTPTSGTFSARATPHPGPASTSMPHDDPTALHAELHAELHP